MSKEFISKNKKFFIPAGIILGLVLLPFTIGGLFIWLVSKYTKNKTLKYAAIAIILIPTLFIGSAYVAAIVNPSSNKPAQTTQISSPKPSVPQNTQQPSNTPSVSVMPSPATSSSAPKPTATTTNSAVYESKQGTEATGNYSCGSKKYCNQMTNCAEAKFYLNTCGLKRLDADNDGIPCEDKCLN